MPIKRPMPADAAPGRGGPPAASKWAIDYPSLHGYVSDVLWDDGTARKPASLLIFFEDGTTKVCLNDKELDRTGWVSGRTLEDCFASLECQLLDESVDWRRAKAGARQGQRRN